MKAPKRAAKRIPARLVGAAGTTYLVEWVVGDDLKRAYLKRAYIPGELWHEKGVDEETLAAGVPYGLDWESIIKIKANAADIARLLRASGIWTADDFRTNVVVADGVFRRATLLDVFSVMNNMEAKK